MPLFKRSLPRTSITAFAFALLALSLSCAKSEPTGSAPAARASAPDEIIANVNGRPVSRKLYEMFLRNGREALGLNTETEEGRRKLDELREGIVSELIDRALIAQEAEQRGLQVTPERLSQTEQREITKLGGERQFTEYLQTHDLTRDEYRAQIRDMIYGELLTEQAATQTSVTDEEIKTYYEAQRRRSEPSLQLPERVTAAHILVSARSQTISQELQREQNLTGDALAAAVRRELEQRRARAVELRREAARAGANFAELARLYSDDAATRERGGDLGAFAHGAHTRAFDDAAFKLKSGQISEVVETEYGYHIIKLTGREPARAARLEEAAHGIRTRLLAEKRARMLADWLKEARGKAKISIKEDYRFGGLKTEFPA